MNPNIHAESYTPEYNGQANNRVAAMLNCLQIHSLGETEGMGRGTSSRATETRGLHRFIPGGLE